MEDLAFACRKLENVGIEIGRVPRRLVRLGRSELRPSERRFFFWFCLCSAAIGATTAIIEGPSIETGLKVALLVSATIFLLLATWANRL